jgi:hypothetical protein
MTAARIMLLLASASMVALAAATPSVKSWLAVGEGAELYDGRRALVARLRGHDEALPPAAARCINCHEGPQAIGPALDGQLLLQKQARRGGPPSRYDELSLCRLLREGTDPAHVMLPRAMPRYEIGDADCAALWSHLVRR